jgi:hypothetical protein
MPFKICRVCGKQVREVDRQCWNCRSLDFEDSPTPGASSFADGTERPAQGVGASAPSNAPPKQQVRPFHFLMAALLLALAYVFVNSWNTPSTGARPVGLRSAGSEASSGGCKEFNPARKGWLQDHDQRGEVALWSNPAQPQGNIIKSVVSFGVLPRGESMITDVSRACAIDGVFYYYVQFDDLHAGWVDVDYLNWTKPTR